SIMSSSRRSSSSASASSPPTTQPSTPTMKSAPLTPNFNSRKSIGGTPRKINPVRRCQSMRYPNMKNGLNLTPQSSLKSRRVSSTPSSLENGKHENEFVKYYQFKTSKADPMSLLNITIADDLEDCKKSHIFRFLIVGYAGCGKSSIVSQFHNYLETKKKILHEDKHLIEDRNNAPGETLVMNFQKMTSLENCLPTSPIALYQPDGYIIVYAINDRQVSEVNEESFEGAKKSINEIYKWDDVETKPIILVANKTDLVRSRVVSRQGLINYSHITK
ncbi:GTP-binding protein REM-like protein, partial [Dinothrombium tinctorium]